MRFSPDPAAVFTAASNNYLHFARTLAQSIRACDPAADVHCVVADLDPAPARALAAEFSGIPLEELRLPGGKAFLFQYSVLELNTALKPWAFEALLDKGYRTVTYLDPDVRVYRPLDEPARLLAGGADIVLTPHLLAPMDDGRRPSELDIRRAGTYNLGFCAVRESANTRNFLKWWQAKLAQDCVVDPDRGLFVDQSWIDLVPGLFPNVAILRHPGYNVAYWNIGQRRIGKAPGGGWLAGGEPLAFFHFSGLDPFDAETFSRQQDRFRLADLGAAQELVRDYAHSVLRNGAQAYAALPYGFGSFTDGTPVPALARRLYRENGDLRAIAGANPFAARRAVEQYVQKARPSRQAGGAASTGAARVQALFWTLLGRAPEQEALNTFARRCETPLGYLGAWKAIGLSPESRARPQLARRMLKALSGP
jgi:hypothetical protein